MEGFVQGLHRSPYLGFSVDFAEYRQYMPGRRHPAHRLERVTARSDKLFIKLYEGETNTRVLVLLDVSGSMNYGSGRDQEDRLRAHPGRLPVLLCLPPARRRRPADFRYRRPRRTFRRAGDAGQLLNILQEIDRRRARQGNRIPETAAIPGRNPEPARPDRRDFRFLRRSGQHLAGLKELKAKGNDIMVFHIMDDFELTFPFRGNGAVRRPGNKKETSRHSRIPAEAVSVNPQRSHEDS